MLLTVADERGNPVATGAQRSEACDIPELTVHGPPRVGRLLGASAIFFFFFRSTDRSMDAARFARRSVLFCSERRTTRAAAGECQYTALSSA
jgi:hypothetical protein